MKGSPLRFGKKKKEFFCMDWEKMATYRASFGRMLLTLKVKEFVGNEKVNNVMIKLRTKDPLCNF